MRPGYLGLVGPKVAASPNEDAVKKPYQPSNPSTPRSQKQEDLPRPARTIGRLASSGFLVHEPEKDQASQQKPGDEGSKGLSAKNSPQPEEAATKKAEDASGKNQANGDSQKPGDEGSKGLPQKNSHQPEEAATKKAENASNKNQANGASAEKKTEPGAEERGTAHFGDEDDKDGQEKKAGPPNIASTPKSQLRPGRDVHRQQTDDSVAPESVAGSQQKEHQTKECPPSPNASMHTAGLGDQSMTDELSMRSCPSHMPTPKVQPKPQDELEAAANRSQPSESQANEEVMELAEDEDELPPRIRELYRLHSAKQQKLAKIRDIKEEEEMRRIEESRLAAMSARKKLAHVSAAEAAQRSEELFKMHSQKQQMLARKRQQRAEDEHKKIEEERARARPTGTKVEPSLANALLASERLHLDAERRDRDRQLILAENETKQHLMQHMASTSTSTQGIGARCQELYDDAIERRRRQEIRAKEAIKQEEVAEKPESPVPGRKANHDYLERLYQEHAEKMKRHAKVAQDNFKKEEEVKESILKARSEAIKKRARNHPETVQQGDASRMTPPRKHEAEKEKEKEDPDKLKSGPKPIVKEEFLLSTVLVALQLRCGIYGLTPQSPEIRPVLAPLKALNELIRETVLGIEQSEGYLSLSARQSKRLYFAGQFMPELDAYTKYYEPDPIRQVEEDLDELLITAQTAHELLKSKIAPNASWPGGIASRPAGVPTAMLAADNGMKLKSAAAGKAMVLYGPAEGPKRFRHLLDLARVEIVFGNCHMLELGIDNVLKIFDEVLVVRNNLNTPGGLGRAWVEILVVIRVPKGDNVVPHVCEIRLVESSVSAAQPKICVLLDKVYRILTAILASAHIDPDAGRYLIQSVLAKPPENHTLRVFKRHFAAQHGSTTAAWRKSFGNNIRILNFQRWKDVCQELRYNENCCELWLDLDPGKAGCISLFEFDPEAVVLLASFRDRIILLPEARKDQALDDSDFEAVFNRLCFNIRPLRAGHLEPAEFRSISKSLGFTKTEGDRIFELLQCNAGHRKGQCGTITPADIGWLLHLTKVVDVWHVKMLKDGAFTATGCLMEKVAPGIMACPRHSMTRASLSRLGSSRATLGMRSSLSTVIQRQEPGSVSLSPPPGPRMSVRASIPENTTVPDVGGGRVTQSASPTRRSRLEARNSIGGLPRVSRMSGLLVTSSQSLQAPNTVRDRVKTDPEKEKKINNFPAVAHAVCATTSWKADGRSCAGAAHWPMPMPAPPPKKTDKIEEEFTADKLPTPTSSPPRSPRKPAPRSQLEAEYLAECRRTPPTSHAEANDTNVDTSSAEPLPTPSPQAESGSTASVGEPVPTPTASAEAERVSTASIGGPLPTPAANAEAERVSTASIGGPLPTPTANAEAERVSTASIGGPLPTPAANTEAERVSTASIGGPLPTPTANTEAERVSTASIGGPLPTPTANTQAERGSTAPAVAPLPTPTANAEAERGSTVPAIAPLPTPTANAEEDSTVRPRSPNSGEKGKPEQRAVSWPKLIPHIEGMPVGKTKSETMLDLTPYRANTFIEAQPRTPAESWCTDGGSPGRSFTEQDLHERKTFDLTPYRPEKPAVEEEPKKEEAKADGDEKEEEEEDEDEDEDEEEEEEEEEDDEEEGEEEEENQQQQQQQQQQPQQQQANHQEGNKQSSTSRVSFKEPPVQVLEPIEFGEDEEVF